MIGLIGQSQWQYNIEGFNQFMIIEPQNTLVSVGIDMMVKYYKLDDLNINPYKIINLDYEPTTIHINKHIYLADHQQLHLIEQSQPSQLLCQLPADIRKLQSTDNNDLLIMADTIYKYTFHDRSVQPVYQDTLVLDFKMVDSQSMIILTNQGSVVLYNQQIVGTVQVQLDHSVHDYCQFDCQIDRLFVPGSKMVQVVQIGQDNQLRLVEQQDIVSYIDIVRIVKRVQDVNVVVDVNNVLYLEHHNTIIYKLKTISQVIQLDYLLHSTTFDLYYASIDGQFTNLTFNLPQQQDQQQDQQQEQQQKQNSKSNKEQNHYDILERQIQQIFNPSQCKKYQNGRRFLFLSQIGSIYLRKSETSENEFINIEFADKNYHSNMVLNNSFNAQMAHMNYQGAVIASRLKESDLDEYEDENQLQFQEYCQIVFKSFNKQLYGNDFEVKMQQNEDINGISISTDYIVVVTDFQLIRVLDLQGNQISSICFNNAFVSVISYEHIFSILYLEGPPHFGAQNIKIQNYEFSQRIKVGSNIGLCLTVETELKYLGYSNEGNMICEDSSGLVKMLINNEYWVQIYGSQKEKKFFQLIGVSNYQLLGVYLNSCDDEPSVLPRQIVHQKEIQLNTVVASNINDVQQRLIKMSVQRLVLDNEKQYRQQFMVYKLTRPDNDMLRKVHANIMDSNEISMMEKTMDREYLDLVRQCLVDKDYSQAISILNKYVINIQSLKICLKLAERLEVKMVQPIIYNLIQMREHQNCVGNNGSVNQVQVVESSQIQINQPKKHKFGLTLQQRAIQNDVLVPVTQSQIQSTNYQVDQIQMQNQIDQIQMQNQVDQIQQDQNQVENRNMKVTNPFLNNSDKTDEQFDIFNQFKKNKV